MVQKEILNGVIHKVPADLWKVLISSQRHYRYGRILRHWRAMNGSVGLSQSRNWRRESFISKGHSRSLKKENVGLVAGRVVLILEINKQNDILNLCKK